MEFSWTVAEYLVVVSAVDASLLFSPIIIEAYRRRNNNRHVDSPPAIFEDLDSLYQIINVDDGSSDGTKRVAFSYVKKYTLDNIRVILLGKNHGKGEAIRKGMLNSRGELLLMLDADGATKVNDLEKLENQILAVAKEKYDLGYSSASDSEFKISDIPIAAFGSRAHLEEKASATRKWYHNVLMKGFHFVVLLTAGPGIRGTQCGFKMFTRAAARQLFTNIRIRRVGALMWRLYFYANGWVST